MKQSWLGRVRMQRWVLFGQSGNGAQSLTKIDLRRLTRQDGGIAANSTHLHRPLQLEGVSQRHVRFQCQGAQKGTITPRSMLHHLLKSGRPSILARKFQMLPPCDDDGAGTVLIFAGL